MDETKTFPRAIACLTEGATITRLEWGDDDIYCKLHDAILMIHRDGRWFKWIVNEGDLLAADWVIVA